MKTKSAAEEAFSFLISSRSDIPEPKRQYRFHKTRRWKFDFAWPQELVAVEIEGLTSPYADPGRHQRTRGFTKDCEKYEAALELGWTVYRIPSIWVWNRKRIVVRKRTFDILRTLLSISPGSMNPD